MATEQMCACGQPLHYLSPLTRKLVEELIAELGECVIVVVQSRKFSVPRHFIALHGIKAWELPAMAKRYGFKEIANEEV